VALTVSWIRKVTRRAGMYLVRVPEDYEGLFRAMRGHKVRARVGGYTFKGRVVEVGGYIYVSLPREAEVLWVKRKPFEVEVVT